MTIVFAQMCETNEGIVESGNACCNVVRAPHDTLILLRQSRRAAQLFCSPILLGEPPRHERVTRMFRLEMTITTTFRHSYIHRWTKLKAGHGPLKCCTPFATQREPSKWQCH